VENMNLDQLHKHREKLLKIYHTKKDDLEFAEDDMEEDWIEEKLDIYRVKIRACNEKIKELESILSSK